ncbi:MAG: hypothetical protein ISR58_18730 [Anaerolineales bacterium]|nr:hypothetical protein [Chloroflexota bacterium]MBL6983217.1 hypothetical protein [Anaerolineales bacterium]
MLILAAILAIAIGVAHSWLGERYIISRLLRRDNLPKLFGDDSFTKQTLRYGWHLTTTAWWGLGLILLISGGLLPEIDLRRGVILTVGFTFLVSAAFSFIFTRGRHLSWVVFLAIAVLSGIAAF